MITPLNTHHVPVNLGLVPIAGLIVGLPGREMERTGYFLIKQNIPHRLTDFRIKPQGEFTNIPCAVISIENLINLPGLPLCLCAHYLALLEL